MKISDLEEKLALARVDALAAIHLRDFEALMRCKAEVDAYRQILAMRRAKAKRNLAVVIPFKRPPR